MRADGIWFASAAACLVCNRHVDFILFVLYSFALGGQLIFATEMRFLVEYGLELSYRIMDYDITNIISYFESHSTTFRS